MGVLTQPPARAGRGQRYQESPVSQAAKQRGLPVLTPIAWNDPSLRDLIVETFGGPAPDILWLFAYGQLLPRWAIDWPTRGSWNFHPSDLPRWRGAAPVPRAIEAGDRKTAACVVKMTPQLDAGPILLRREVAIDPEDTTASLTARMTPLSASLCVDALNIIAENEAPHLEPQALSGIRYAGKIEKREAMIDFSANAETIARKVRALNPYPLAFAFDERGKRVAVTEARTFQTKVTAKPGHLLNEDGLVVACGCGALRLLRLRPEGGREMDAASFRAGLANRPDFAFKAPG